VRNVGPAALCLFSLIPAAFTSIPYLMRLEGLEIPVEALPPECRYRETLSGWRKRMPENPRAQMRLYLNVFSAVLSSVKVSKVSSQLLSSTC